MVNTTPTVPEPNLDAVFGALSNTTRRGLLSRLGAGDATISELAAPLAMSLPAVSKHLRVLENAGLVDRTKEGKAHRCSLVPDPLNGAEAWLNQRRTHWAASLDSLASYLEQDNTAGKGDQ